MAAHQVSLVWKCPACDGEQTWEWKHWNFHRPEDFIPRPQKSGQQELPKPGTYGGMKWLDDDNGRRSIEERARSAWWECIWCGHRIHDSRQNRQSLMDSYVQDYKLARGLIPRQVCFTLPFEAARDNRFESTVANFLIAKEAKRLGNEVPMQDWFIAERAMFYEPNILRGTAPVITGSYDVKEKILDEVCRVMFVDCQQDDSLTATTGKSTMGKFWWVARAIDKNGNMFQLSRGWGGLEDWQAEQKRLEISNENLGIDGGFWRNDVIDLAARFIAPYERRIRKHGRWRAETIWHTYTVLVGDGKRTSWKWQDGHSRSISPMQPQSRRVTLKDQTAEIKIPLYQWSNLGIKDQLDNLISGKSEVQFKSLSRNQLPESVQIRETGNLTYENQMSAEFRTQKKTGQPYWEKSRPDNHYFDCEAGCLALFGLGGFLGVAAAPETEANSET